jgi:hypothetical protein
MLNNTFVTACCYLYLVDPACHAIAVALATAG